MDNRRSSATRFAKSERKCELINIEGAATEGATGKRGMQHWEARKSVGLNWRKRCEPTEPRATTERNDSLGEETKQFRIFALDSSTT